MIMNVIKKYALSYSTLLMLIFSVASTHAQKRIKDVFVDKNGVMRWGNTKEEVYGFGVNYTPAFAHGYRVAQKLNVDVESAIANDIYHFSRLGFDAFRVHVWDTEISDTIGNILDNEHLKTFDFMLAKMKERKIKIFLTPIAFWGNGYPERDEKTPGFSHKYGKDACLTNPAAIAAQEKYLYQFLNHVNPYTKIAYKDDPDIIGFEVSNEPHHKGSPESVITYINKMVAAMRKTGCKKPILYNISHSIHLSEAYFKANIDGGTFQWYPTGLGARHELRGNFLPNVDQYRIPFAKEKGFMAGAKIVYEFDAADVGRSYIYPAMARSFRSAGIQWATHFAYDPTFLAHVNTEYNTHFMNLVYAPQKALSLKIASEVFHQVPRYKDYGKYPQNATFDNFRVSYEEDLAELVSIEKFFYTNNTKRLPPEPSSLQQIAGFGNSSVVQYEGTGAYFLDKIEDGVWRLEVMPDAIWVDNLFGQNSLDKTVAVINRRRWPIRVDLPNLAKEFAVKSLKSGSPQFDAKEGAFEVEPGVYLLIKRGTSTKLKGNEKWNEIKLNEYYAPDVKLTKDYLLHSPIAETTTGESLKLKAKVVTRELADSIIVYIPSIGRAGSYPMHKISGYDYEADLPAEIVKEGFLHYYITVFQSRKATTYPSEIDKTPTDWDFFGAPYQTSIVDKTSPLFLFYAATDHSEVSKEWRRGSKLLPGSQPGTSMMVVTLEALSQKDDENANGPVIKDYSLRYNFAPKIRGRLIHLPEFTRIVVKGKSLEGDLPIQVSFIDKKADIFGATMVMKNVYGDYSFDVRELRPVKMVTLPRPYPTFLPYYFDSGNKNASGIDLREIETVQISIGPGLQDDGRKIGFEIESLRLEK
jgi:hypothetical protein